MHGGRAHPVELIRSMCHGLGLVDNNEMIFLSKLVQPSSRISNLERKEEEESIYRVKGIYLWVVTLVLYLFACSGGGVEALSRHTTDVTFSWLPSCARKGWPDVSALATTLAVTVRPHGIPCLINLVGIFKRNAMLLYSDLYMIKPLSDGLWIFIFCMLMIISSR